MATTPKDKEAEEGVEDMIKLGDLNETTILQNLRVRYGRDHIYTYIGSILVAVNPYRMFNFYGLDMVQRYEGQQIGDLPPHLFAVASSSYSKMVKEKQNQVLVISGESGAGKTESTKLVMQYLAAVNKSGSSLITEQILEATPLLESFGNAKTIRNDNSSRFGKYIEVFFNDGGIVGARTLEYLLEKSRIVTQAPEERNYHVFYEMLEAMTDEQKSKYGLQTSPKYFYLNQGGSAVIPGRDDAENFRKLLAAMDVLDFNREEQDTIQKILASVLHIGNIYFKSVQENNHDKVELGSDAEIRWVSHLLQLSEEWLKQAVLSKITEARGDRVVTPYNLDQALDARDAMAKALYSRLFTWLVERINLIICRAEREKITSLAVLDIFGFEDFHHNSFEQLCINYANETLQFFFNQHIFQLEQREYSKEKIRWQHIDFKDNQPTIDLIATKPTGILHILDDECNFPQSRDQSFLEKCHFHHSSNPLYDKPRMSDPEFYITHYAGRIKYNVIHFLEKNKDTLRSDVVELMCESKNKIIAQMFSDLRDRQITKTLSKTTGRYVTLKPRTPTVAASFNESLLSLIDTMSRCHPYFVRCVKPNTQKKAMLFEDEVVMDQLRYTGMLETIRIRRMGYPVRIKFPVFIQRYRCLLRGQVIRQNQLPTEVSSMILATQGPAFKDQYQIGATKVFMKESFEVHMDEASRTIQREAAICIQTRTRTFLARSKYLKARAASRTIQRMSRMWKTRRDFLTTRNGIVRAQAQFRMFLQRKRYVKTREEIRRQLEEQKLAKRQQEAREKLEREKREREARAMASIANLEVPGELAYVYNKLDDWRLVHDGKNIITAVGDVQPMDMGYRLPVDINSHPFSKFTSVYFKNPEWGVKKEPLHTSLTTVQGEALSHRALSLFKLILRYMCETNMSEKKEKVLADYIVQMGLEQVGLRDEILCQVVNQTWLNQDLQQAERMWKLAASCLSAFMPSSALFKYLLKYVSDVGINGYKWICQHKVLQSANLDPQLSRVYPPCFLEWRAIERKANMALEVKFPDDINMIGHVESWSSGELMASHLLKQRGMVDNTQGWTVVLQEDVERYELMGYDYVLDLLSEMELAPGFPHCKAYFLVSFDRTQERLHHKQHHGEGPHSSEQERILVLTGPLPEMLKRSTPVVTPGQGKSSAAAAASTTNGNTNGAMDDMGFSTTSVLNQRPTDILTSELSESRMNHRYTKRRAPAPPTTTTNGHVPNGHVPNGHVNGMVVMNGDISTITEDDDDLDLSHTRLNGRYFPEGMPNEHDLSASRLNTRYTKKAAVPQGGVRKSAVQDQIRKKQGVGVTMADVHSVTSEQSDWSQWVEGVFNNALDEHDDVTSEGRSLHSRIKGGGKGVPGVQTQQTSVPPNLNLGLGLTSPANVGAPPMVSPAFAFNAQLTPGLQPQQEALQQLMSQQQQAMQQAAIQNLLMQRQQQQAAVLQALSQQQQQQQQQVAAQAVVNQMASMQAALQQTELENRLLKQSIERENLKKQLQQMQHPTAGSPPGSAGAVTSPRFATHTISPDTSMNSSAATTATATSLHSPRNFQFSAAESVAMAAARPSAVAPPPVAPKRVQFIKSNIEAQAAAAALENGGEHYSSQVQGSSRTTKTVSFTTTSTVQSQGGSAATSATSAAAAATSLFGQDKPPSSPPPPPLPSHPPPPLPSSPPPPLPSTSAAAAAAEEIYADAFSDAPSLHTQPKSPLPPPPVPPPPPPMSTTPSGLEIDKEKGTFTIRDKEGRARTVRIGKVVWPPPTEGVHKKEVHVGKLEIDEKVAQGIENRIIGKKKWQKPPPPPGFEEGPRSILKKGTEDKDQRLRRAKSLVESSSHSATLKLLESKLGGGGGNKAQATPPPPPPVPAIPPPMSESVSVQTTDTLKKKTATVSTSQEMESIYASTVVTDEPVPPPLPRHPPPVLKVLKKETVEVQEQFDTVIVRDEPKEQFQPLLEPDLAPPKPPHIDYSGFERVITELFPQNRKHFLMYNKVPWTLHIRKEVFWPSERLENKTMLHLIYCQVAQDVYNSACVRISKDQRVKMRSMLEGYGVNKSNYLTKELNMQVKKVIVDTAKEWPTYFCRLFPVAGNSHYTGVRYLGVSHTGLRLITRERNLVDDHLSVMEDIRFEDVVDVVLPNSTTIQLNLRTKSLLFHTPRAHQLKDMIDRFCQESEKGNKFVVAVKDYLTRESTLLSFRRGDIVKLMDPEMNLERGWLYGSLNGIVGLFPEEYVRPLARHEVETSNMKPKLYQPPQTGRQSSREGPPGPDDRSETSQGTIVNDGKYSMMEFALLNFRESLDNEEWRYEMLRTEDGSIRGTVKMIENIKLHNLQKDADSKHRGSSGDWSWKEHAEMIKWTRSPIQASLLKLSSSELNKLALECFIAIMRFMGDYPMGSNQSEFDCVMKILRSCHKYPELRDEVFCQLCKQTTNNRSMRGKSKIKGWRLFALVAAYCDCSDTLRPYLFKYLETTASDINRTYNHAAALCLQNLRKTFKYGGRKNVPLREEVQALADGRNCKRFPFFYSGTEIQGGLLQVKSCTVVHDAIVDVCTGLNINDPVEMEEYTLFIRTGDGVFSKLSSEEYILDVTAEFVRKKTHYDLIFQRTVWIYSLSHMDNEIYVDMMFHQCIFDYMDGLLIVRPGGEPPAQIVDEMSVMAALLHKANDFVGLPTLKQLEVLVPKTMRNGPLIRPQQWLNRIQERQKEVGGRSSLAAKALFLEILSNWPLFGSTFFLIKSIPNMTAECKLAVNRKGISFLHRDTHEIILAHPFSEILSTRRYRSDSGGNYLDMKIGNLMVQKILRIETDQGSDISNLIGQYMQVINRRHKHSERL
ncbi:unconventional myosin-XV-like isoform X2 [Babylonia areolata]|uniref:unconventional myosin-XV-like isoform X2 n=1 Tax=Babylonia areolata TaxID=304850 RepID=UPI003FD1E4CD